MLFDVEICKRVSLIRSGITVVISIVSYRVSPWIVPVRGETRKIHEITRIKHEQNRLAGIPATQIANAARNLSELHSGKALDEDRQPPTPD